MNEYKVQLESREDLTFLREEMSKFISETDNSVPEAIKQQVKSVNFSVRRLFLSLSIYLSIHPFISTWNGSLPSLPKIAR